MLLSFELPVFEQCRPGSAPDVFIPQRAHPGDAGHDVRVYVEEPAWSDEVAGYFGHYRRWLNTDLLPEYERLRPYLLCINREPLLQLPRGQSLAELRQLAEQQLWEWETKLRQSRGILLQPGGHVVLPAGFKVALPELPEPWTLVMKLVGRSGWAGLDRVCVSNSPGIIDCRYRREVHVSLENRSPRAYLLLNETRVAQALFEVVLSFDPRQRRVDHIEDTGRGGYGSTG